MILSPLPRRLVKKTPIGLMLPGGMILDESGEIALPHFTKAHIAYCVSPMHPLRAAKRIGATGILLGNKGSKRWVRFNFGNLTVFPGVEGATLDGLVALRDAALSHGVRAGSLQGMAFMLCRSTLAGFVRIAENEKELPLDELPLGARLYDRPGVYPTLESFDIRAAYLWGISTLPVPSSYAHVRRIHANELYAEESGFVRVTVWLKPFPIGPVPFLLNGTTVFPVGRDRLRRILLTLDDFRLLMEMGLRFSIEEAWLGTKHIKPFDSFGFLMQEWRKDKVMGGVAKQVANTLWGSFGSNASVWEATILPHSPRMKVKKYPPRVPRSLSVSSSVIGRLRAKVYREGVGSGVVHIHTDGLMTTSPGIALGEEIGEWRNTGRRTNVEVLAPGWYAYDTENGRTYKTSGKTLTDKASRIAFANMRDRVISGNPPEKQKGIFS